MKIASATAVFQVMLRRPRRVRASASRVDRMPGLGSWQLLRWGIPQHDAARGGVSERN